MVSRRQPAMPAHTTSPRHDLDLRTLYQRLCWPQTMHNASRLPHHKCSIELPIDPGGGWRGKCCEGSLFRAHEGAATWPPTQICRAAPTPRCYPGPEPESRLQRRGLGRGDRAGLVLCQRRDHARVISLYTCGPASLASKSVFK